MDACLGRAEGLSVYPDLKGIVEQPQWLLKIGERVAFHIKDEKGFRRLEGTVKRIMSSKEAKLKGYLKGKKTGRVLEIVTDDNKTYYKFKKTVDRLEEA